MGVADAGLRFNLFARDQTGAGTRSAMGNFKKLGAIAGAAGVGAALVSSVNKAATFDKTIRVAGAASNATAEDMKAMSKTALDLGAKTQFGAQGAADAMVELSKAGMSVAQQKAGALQNTLLLASAGGLQLGAAATYMTNSLNTFGLQAGDANQVAVALAGGANASTASVESLGMALGQVGPGAKNAGLSLQETVGVLAAFDNAGIKGSDAGTSLKTMLTRLVPATKSAQKAADQFGLSFTDASGNIDSVTTVAQKLKDKLGGLSEEQRTVALTQIFGSDATRAATVLMDQGAKGVQKYIDATRDKAAADAAAKAQTDGAAGNMAKFKAAVDSLQISFALNLLPAISKIAGALANLINGVIPKVTPAFDAIKGAISPLMPYVTQFWNILTGKGTGGGSERTAALGQVGEAAMSLRRTFIQVVGWVKNSFIPGMRGAIAAVLPIWKKYATFMLTQVYPAIAKLIRFVMTQVLPALKQWAVQLWTKLQPALKQLGTTIQTQIWPAVQRLIAAFIAAWPTIKRLGDILVTVAGFILSRVLPNVIKISGVLIGTFAGAVAIAIRVVAKIIGFILRFSGALIDAGKKAWNFVSAIGSAFKSAYDAVVKGVGDAVDFVKGFPGKVTDAVGNLGSLLLSAGQDLVQGMINGIRNGAGWLYDEIKSALVDKPKDLITHPWKIFSPSRVTMGYGANISEGLAIGVKNKAPAVAKAVTIGLVAKPTAALRKLDYRLTYKLGKSLADGLASGVKDKKQTALDAIKDMGSAMLDKLKEQMDKVRDFSQGIKDLFADSKSLTAIDTSFGESDLGVSGLLQGLKDKARQAKQFTAAINTLRRMGLNEGSIANLRDAGPDGGLKAAQQLISGGKGAVNEVNQLTKQINMTASQFANSETKRKFGYGTNAKVTVVSGKLHLSMDYSKVSGDKLIAFLQEAVRIRGGDVSVVLGGKKK